MGRVRAPSRPIRRRRAARQPRADLVQSRPDRHFSGHGVFSADGKMLYTTENDYDNAQGMIGVRDATGGYKQIGEFDAHGMEPHDIALLSDGRTMVIANGGIRTHPDQRLGRAQHPRHETVARLYRRDHRRSHRGASSGARAAPALDSPSRHRRRRRRRVRLPISRARRRRAARCWASTASARSRSSCRHRADAIRAQNYVGSVATDAGGAIVAASAPKGSLITYWDVSARNYLGSCALNDGCGLAPTRQASFLLTSGEGWLATGETPMAIRSGNRRLPMGQSRNSRPLRRLLPASRLRWPILTLFLGLISARCVASWPSVAEAIHVARFGAYIDVDWGRAFPA